MATSADHYQHPHPLPPPPPPLHHHQNQQPQHRQHQSLRHHHEALQTPPEPQEHHYPQTQDQQPPSPSAKRRTFSFHSDNSKHAAGVKLDLHETHAEKESKRLHSKADPTLAMNEAEPSAVAAMKTEASFAPLRSLQHRDSTGNVISEPDKSNPTRHRWERPLDTIRSFEAAIDGGYARKSMYRADTDSAVHSNRRSSFHPGSQSRVWQQDGYNNSNYNVSSRPVSMRHDHNNHGNSRHSYYEGQGYNGGYGPPPVPRQRASRQYSEPHFQNYRREQNVYPLPHKDRSYETVTSAAGSGNSDNAGYQTDPTSSDNSSIERASPPKRMEPVNDYGISFNPANAKQAQNFSVTLPANRGNPLPPLPQGTDQKMAPQPIQRKMVKRQPSAAVAPAAPTNEKRKSWFSRRFSKQ